MIYLSLHVRGDFGDNVLLADIGGNGSQDLIVGDPDHGVGGAVLIIMDPEAGNITSLDADFVITGESGSMFGTSVAVADFNEDNMTDIIVGAPNASMGNGSVFIFLGPFSNMSYQDSNATIQPERGFMGFGAMIEPAEVNGDNHTDLAVASIYQPRADGLIASYYNEITPDVRVGISMVDGIGVNWRSGGPPGVDADTFMARWTGFLYCNETGEHTFWADVDDGVRVWIDGELIINDWTNDVKNVSATLDLLEGYHDFRVEYYENSGDAFAYVNWSTPYESGPIPSSNLRPSLAFPISLLHGSADHSDWGVDDILIADIFSNSLGSEMEDTEEGLFIGSWSTGHVYLHDGTAIGATKTYFGYPQFKGSNDEVNKPVTFLWGDDNKYYEVENGASKDDMEIDTFYLYLLPHIAREFGEIESASLMVRYKTGQYYVWQGNGDQNYIKYAVEGKSYADLIQPNRTVSETDMSGIFPRENVTSFFEIEDLNVAFNNGDQGTGAQDQDSVYFEYMLIKVIVELPILTRYVRGPHSFGSSLGASGSTLWVGAPKAGQFNRDFEIIGGLNGGSMFSFDLGSLPSNAVDARKVIIGPPGSELGSSASGWNSTFAFGAPGNTMDLSTGMVLAVDDEGLTGSGICPYVDGNAGYSISMSEGFLATGNPAISTIHLIRLAESPTIDLKDSVDLYSSGPTEFSIDISTVEILNVTAVTLSEWESDINGSEWTRTDADEQLLTVNISTDPELDAPVIAIGRAPDGLTSGIDLMWIRMSEAANSIDDLHIIRADGAQFSSSVGGVAGEASTLRTFIDYSGPDLGSRQLEISNETSFMNRTFPMPSDVILIGDQVTMSSYGVDAWKASDQMGSISTTSILNSSHYSWRVIVNGSYLLQRAGSIRLKFFSPVDLTFDQVSIAYASSDRRNVVDQSVTGATFDGEAYYSSSPGEVFWSDWIDFDLDPDRIHSVSFHTQVRGPNKISYLHGTGVGATYSLNGDYRGDRDWSNDQLDTWDFSAYLLSIEGEVLPSQISMISKPIHSDAGFNYIGWTGIFPQGTGLKVRIRTAEDLGGMPSNWSAWHGPTPDGFYHDPSDIAEPNEWIQYHLVLTSLDGMNAPVMDSFYFGTGAGYIVQDEWKGSLDASWGTGGFSDHEIQYSIDVLWRMHSGSHNISVIVDEAVAEFSVPMESNEPNGDVNVTGIIKNSKNDPVPDALIHLTNARTWESLNYSSDLNGNYAFALEDLADGYHDGDEFLINATFESLSGSETFSIYSADGDRQAPLMIAQEGIDVLIELQETPFGPSYIRMYRESDGNETKYPSKGENTLLKARLLNRGEMTARNASVAFLDNGTPIGTPQPLNMKPWTSYEIEQWWTPDPGWTNLSIKVWGMKNLEHLFSADLWDSPLVIGRQVDFTMEVYNTPDDLNSFGINETDPSSSFDGWDWSAGSFGGSDSDHVEFGDPGNDSDGFANGRVEIRIADGADLEGNASGAWGTQFYIDPKDFAVWTTGVVYLNLTYWFDNLNGTLVGDSAILGRIRNGDRTLWLGNDAYPFDPPNRSIFTKSSDTEFVSGYRFSQDVGSFFTESGHYYLDFGLILEGPSTGASGAGAYFDNVSIVFMNDVLDPHSATDEYWSNVTILPVYPTTPFNASIHFYDNYNGTGLEVNYTILVDRGSLWTSNGSANETGHGNFTILPGNYTEASILSIGVDHVLDEVRYIGGFETIFYSYESPIEIEMPLYSYGFVMESIVDHESEVPGGVLEYSFELSSESNVAIEINITNAGLPADWMINVTGPNVNGSGSDYLVEIDAYSSAIISCEVEISGDPESVPPGNYSWEILCDAWFANHSLVMTTQVEADHRFAIGEILAREIAPDESPAFNITLFNLGNVDNIIDINITAHRDWSVFIPNTSVELKPNGSGSLMFHLSAPGWPEGNMTAGTDHTFSILATSRDSSEFASANIGVRVGNLHHIIMNGSHVTCEPGIEVVYQLLVANYGNLPEDVNLTVEWNRSLGNVSLPLPERVGIWKTDHFHFKFTPTSDLNVSTAGNVVPVNVSFNDSAWTMLFTVEQVDSIQIDEPDITETVIGQETDLGIVVESRGNGIANYSLLIENGESRYSNIDLTPWEEQTIWITTTPNTDGWSNVSLSLLRENSTISTIVAPVMVSRGYVDFIAGTEEKVADNVEAFDVSASTGDIAFISNSSYYYMPKDDISYRIGPTDASDIEITNQGSTYIALGGSGVKVIEIGGQKGSYHIERSWTIDNKGKTVQLDTSEFKEGKKAIYLMWTDDHGVNFRSMSDLNGGSWNPEIQIWNGTSTVIEMTAQVNEIHLAWNGLGAVHYKSVTYYGSANTHHVRVVDVPRSSSIALSMYDDLHLAWSSDGVVYTSVHDDGWSDPEVLSLGTEVSSATISNVTSFGIARDFMALAQTPKGLIQVSSRGNPSSPLLIGGMNGTVYYLDDGLRAIDVVSPIHIDWNDTITMNFRLENWGDSVIDGVPAIITSDNWSARMQGIVVPPNDEIYAEMEISSPTSILSESNTVVSVVFNNVELASVPVFITRPVIHGLSLLGIVNATPDQTTSSELTILNVGNTDEVVTIEIGAPEGWEISVEDQVQIIPRGGSASTNLTVLAPADTLTGSFEIGLAYGGRTKKFQIFVEIEQLPPVIVSVIAPNSVESLVPATLILESIRTTNVTWSFSDGSTLYGASTNTSFGIPGKNTVTVNASNNAGSSTTTFKIDVVNRNPVDINFTHGSLMTGEKAMFSASATDPEGFPLIYTWKIGQEEFTGQWLNYTFDKEGEHRISLKATDPHGGLVSVSKTVTVSKTEEKDPGLFGSPLINAGISLVATITLVAFTYARSSGVKAGTAGKKGEGGIEELKEKWPDYMDAVRDMNPRAAFIFRSAQILKYDRSTNVIKLGLTPLERRKVTPKALDAMRKGFQETYGRKVFLFIEMGEDPHSSKQSGGPDQFRKGQSDQKSVKAKPSDDDVVLTPMVKQDPNQDRDRRRRIESWEKDPQKGYTKKTKVKRTTSVKGPSKKIVPSPKGQAGKRVQKEADKDRHPDGSDSPPKKASMQGKKRAKTIKTKKQSKSSKKPSTKGSNKKR